MASTQQRVRRRSVVLGGLALLGGAGFAVTRRDPTAGSTGGDSPENPPGGAELDPELDHSGSDAGPDAHPGDPHVVDPSLDHGIDPGGLTPEMAARIDEASFAAANEGVELTVTSGWRSYAHQEELYAKAVRDHGSEAAARQWVLPPDQSMHVRGLAVDVGPPEGAAWLDENGWRFGLCRRYENEPWHFEPTTSPGGSCPAMQASPGH
ncbi:M15 family metallopeptidase [Phytoactinopolyspora limicola]|uniref:M15 family metallopeptidase n=1 Tax=Phytoactinopolyspora limicola TaxID=2715536 RepID=UPI001A9C6382|nr:M15 family metallopeptidase [Phytoactinopolyspora limicola]